MNGLRLIDADNLRARVNQCCQRYPESTLAKACFGAMLDLIDTEPTVEESPNEPLTLEELREMDGEPVWVKSINDDALFAPTGWAIVTVLDNGDIELDFFGRRDTWVLSEYSEDADEEDEEDEIEAIYRCKPEEGKMGNETN